MATVLITQCLQRDFVAPIGPHDPLPNLLHVGYTEAIRLLDELSAGERPRWTLVDAAWMPKAAAAANQRNRSSR